MVLPEVVVIARLLGDPGTPHVVQSTGLSRNHDQQDQHQSTQHSQQHDPTGLIQTPQLIVMLYKMEKYPLNRYIYNYHGV